MIRQRDFSSLRPLIFVICIVYLLVTIGNIALSFTLRKSAQMHNGVFECDAKADILDCGGVASSTLIQALVWIECLLLTPIIILCMVTLWSRAFVERLPGNTAFAIPGSLILMFVLQIVFLIIFFAKGYISHHWHMDLMLFLQSLFALPVAYLFFNLPQINGDSEPPYLRDDRYNLLKNASSRDKGAASSNSSKRAAPAAKPSQSKTSSNGSATDQPPSGTGSREEEGTGSKEPLPSGEPIPVAPVSDPVATGTAKSEKSTAADKSGKPAAASSKPGTPQPEPKSEPKPEAVPPQRELEDSESKKLKAKHDADQLKSKGSASGTKSASDRLKHTKIVIPPKSKTKSSRSGA